MWSGSSILSKYVTIRHNFITSIAFYKGHNHLFDTELIKKQIEEEKMLVTILFFGSRLAEAVEILETSRKGRDRSYLVIHYHPSLVTVKYNLAKVRPINLSHLPNWTIVYLDALPPLHGSPDEARSGGRELSLQSKQTGQDSLEANRERSSTPLLLPPEVRIQSWGIHRTPPVLQHSPQVR